MKKNSEIKNIEAKNSKKKYSKFKQKLLEDWPAKIICVLIAVLLYLICRVSTLEKRSFATPISIENMGNLVYTNSIPKTVRVTARGEDASVGILQDKDFETFLDLSEYVDEGYFKVPVKIRLSEAAAIVEPLEVHVSPETISLKLERKVTDLCDVKINLIGDCQRGYNVAEYSCKPDKVQITGPSRQVEGTKLLETSPINIAGKKDSFTQKVSIVNQNKLISLTGEEKFVVSVKIAPVQMSKQLESSVIYFMGLASSLAVDNGKFPYTIKISGNQLDVENFTLKEDSVYLDCSDILTSGEYTLPLNVKVSDNIKVESISPEKVTLQVFSYSEKSKDENAEQKDDAKQTS